MLLTLHFGAGQVDGRRVGGRAGADDDDLAMHAPLSDGLELAGASCVLLEGGCYRGD